MFGRILALVKKEFKTTWNDPRSRFLIIFPPILQLLLYTYAVTMEVKNIEMGVLDHAKTAQSRELIARFQGSPRFKHIFILESEAQLHDKLERQEIQLALEISETFSRQIKKEQTAKLQLILDGRQTNVAGILNGYATQIINGYASELTSRTIPLQIITRNLFNPTLNYTWYLLVSLIALLSSMICLILTALSIAREKELGTFEQLLVSPLSSWEILIGKTIPPLSITMVLGTVMVLIVTFVFQINFAGSLLLLLLSMFFSLLCIVGIGLFISSVCRTQQQAVLGVFIFQMPAILLSGFISPIQDMPLVLQYLTYLNPMRFYLLLTKGIFLKDMTFGDVMVNLLPIVLLALLTLTLANWMFKRKMD